jgi:hypothetical protein
MDEMFFIVSPIRYHRSGDHMSLILCQIKHPPSLGKDSTWGDIPAKRIREDAVQHLLYRLRDLAESGSSTSLKSSGEHNKGIERCIAMPPSPVPYLGR